MIFELGKRTHRYTNTRTQAHTYTHTVTHRESYHRVDLYISFVIVNYRTTRHRIFVSSLLKTPPSPQLKIMKATNVFVVFRFSLFVFCVYIGQNARLCEQQQQQQQHRTGLMEVKVGGTCGSGGFGGRRLFVVVVVLRSLTHALSLSLCCLCTAVCVCECVGV